METGSVFFNARKYKTNKMEYSITWSVLKNKKLRMGSSATWTLSLPDKKKITTIQKKTGSQ